MIFHYNTWTRAVITKQLDLLILNFEMRWSLVYQSKVTDPSWCTLKDALLNLSYCCVRCNRIGSSSILCTTTDCVTVQHKSGRSSQPDTKGYFSALKLWKKNNKALIAPYKDLPVSEKAARKRRPSNHPVLSKICHLSCQPLLLPFVTWTTIPHCRTSSRFLR